jgi:hypothetical protein
MKFLMDLPGPMRALFYIIVGTTILGALANFDQRLAIIIGIGTVAMFMAVGVYWIVKGWLEARQARKMTGELSQHSAAAPQAVNDLSRRAKLDDLRQKFSAGIAKMGSPEKIYSFPWYLIVGEPGGGKSEAIRHCNVGFPPGMQDELQGVGGTINMNWWFTNHAVFLDTAGRLMFEEVRAGENNEWKEFLQLLSRNRPNCPINGLILVIPADSLIRDSEKEVHEKAGRIAQQFDTIQRALDIRFPVYVLVTKCDLLAGFREFFDDFADAQSQQQIIGWSNPLDRDEPFQPIMVTNHIETVVQRVKRRRLSLMRDPVARVQERRLDEVDALYAFPHSLSLIAPRLREYMEKIFVAGPWAPKPLFLRGIYFASSMREGEALDQELALALGLAPDQLADDRQWERERAYFLKDLFTEKIFKEAGLVTRASNTRKMLRTRSLILWGSGTALALLFFGFSLYGYKEFQNSIHKHSELWLAAKQHWNPGLWNPVVEPATTGKHAEYMGGERVMDSTEGPLNRVAFQSRLRELAPQRIETSWVYRWMLKAGSLDEERLRAQRIVLDAGVLSPVLEQARRRMKIEALEEARDLHQRDRLSREAEAIAALLRVESQALAKDLPVEAAPVAVFDPLLAYATARPDPAGDQKRQMLDNTVVQTYRTNRKASWPPSWLALSSDSLAANPPIQNGLQRLQTLLKQSMKSQVEKADMLGSLSDDLKEFRKVERDMNTTVALQTSNDEKLKALVSMLTRLGELKLSIDKRVQSAREQDMFTDDKLIMKAAYDRLVIRSQTQADDAFKVVREAAKTPAGHTDKLLFKETDEFLTNTRNSLTSELASRFDEKRLGELSELDPLLADLGAGKRNYEVRWETYSAAYQEANVVDPVGRLLGQNWSSFEKIKQKIGEQRLNVDKLSAQLAPPFSDACKFCLDRAQERRLEAIVTAYVGQSYQAFDLYFHAPYVSGPKLRSMTSADFLEADKDLSIWAGELAPNTLAGLGSHNRTKLEAFSRELPNIRAAEHRAAAKTRGIVTILGYGKGANQQSVFLWRRVSIGGKVYRLDEGDSPTFSASPDGSINANFYDFDLNATRHASVTISVRSLIKSGGRFSVDGAEMNATARLDGPDPAAVSSPPKDRILNTLR